MDIILGFMGKPLCPVSAILNYVAVRGTQPGPFFLNSNKVALSKHQFVTCIRSILQLLGLPQFDYAGHSFRISAATTAATAGVEDSMIQTLGRWQSASLVPRPPPFFSSSVCVQYNTRKRKSAKNGVGLVSFIT